MEEVSGHSYPVESIYGPRTAEYTNRYLSKLNSPPERALNEEQRNQVIQFENSLMDGQVIIYDTILTTALTNEPLDELIDGTSYTQKRCDIALDYLFTPEGKTKLEELGLDYQEGQSEEEIAKDIQRVALTLSPDKLKDLGVKSNDYIEEKVANELAEGEQLTEPNYLVVFSDVSSILRRSQGLFGYRNFLREVNRALKSVPENDDSEVLEAQRTVAKIYIKKINALIATLEPNIIELWQQTEEMDESQKVILQKAISIAWPLLERTNVADRGELQERFMVRLDRVRNGVVVRDGKIGPISEALEKLIEANKQESDANEYNPVFSEDEIAVLDSVEFDASEMQSFCKDILDELGKLSRQPDDDYSPDRSTRAHDGKWQVPIRRDSRAMGVNDPPGAFGIPSNFMRHLTKLTPPVGVVPGAVHEIMHIYQADNTRNNDRGLRIGRDVRGKNATLVNEAGAIFVEKYIQKSLFGRYRRDNPHMIHALKAVESGGNTTDAIQAFYSSYLNQNPSAKKITAARAAVRGVKRLTRRKGGYDTQPLNYAETALIVSETSKLSINENLGFLSLGSFSLEDMTELHKFNLLGLTPEPFPLEKIKEIIETKLREILDNKARQN